MGSKRVDGGESDRGDGRVERREFLKRALAGPALWAAGGATAITSPVMSAPADDAGRPGGGSSPEGGRDARRPWEIPHAELMERGIDDLRRAMGAGEISSRELTTLYLERIEAANQAGPELRAVIEIDSDALANAERLDAERRAGSTRGPLHGIPILLKDNIDTADRMRTTAGSLALMGTRPAQDAGVVDRLRRAGAVLLGKANLSEWANIRSSRSTSGWSARGGQCRNPHVLPRNPCGSSSGSAVAVAAGFCAAALGTETDGSIVCPSHINGIVGIKPTVGLTSRAGVIPISHSQDTVGPHARTVSDAALVLSAIAGADPRDPATSASGAPANPEYTRELDRGALKGARIGVPRKVYFGYSLVADALVERALDAMRAEGAEIIDPAEIPTAETMANDEGELEVLLYELKADMAAYLATRVADRSGTEGPAPRTLQDLIAFNDAHAAEELAIFGQELFLAAQEKGPLTDSNYLAALASNQRLSRQEGIDAVMAAHRLDALVAPTGGPAWPTDWINGDHFLGASSQPAAMAGYPLVTIPVGFVRGLPVGLTFMGRAWSEPVLIRLAFALEQSLGAARPPRFLADIEGA